MATTELEISSTPSTNGEPAFKLCTFCNNSTNGFEKRLFATTQPKGPFFPVLAELQGKKTKLDDLGRAVVCVACFHHLLRQWSSFERRGIPVRKREYNIITGMRFIWLFMYNMAPSKHRGFHLKEFCYQIILLIVRLLVQSDLHWRPLFVFGDRNSVDKSVITLIHFASFRALPYLQTASVVHKIYL